MAGKLPREKWPECWDLSDTEELWWWRGRAGVFWERHVHNGGNEREGVACLRNAWGWTGSGSGCIRITCWLVKCRFSSVQFSHLVVSDSATPWTTACQASLSITSSSTYPNSCPLNLWCNPTISSSVIPSSSHLQSFPASGSFQMSQFFTSGGQSIGVSA